ncbi:MAG TPA: metal-dependent hydrolase [Phycisphaerae bacterium]|nr:metal-dependent hydrolase [Phycisphaerae bacterium]
MFIIDPHCHMVSRTTADYETMALAGVVAISEPAFWAGYDRTPAGFIDYFRQLTETEPKRAAQFAIQHYAWICLNPKEAEDLGKAREVLAEIPKFLSRPTVLGVGEIGLNKNTPNEAKVFQQHVQLAIDCFRATETTSNACDAGKHHLILIHTPHLEDKLKGTRMILDMLKDFGAALDPSRILIDHVEEHTIKLVKDAGYWAGMTIYPVSKCTPQRAVDMLEIYGPDQLCVNAAADWGVSDPLQTHRTMLEAKKRGHPLQTLLHLFHNNPATFFGQNPKFKPKPLAIHPA